MSALHPIVEQLSPSDEQTPAILARGRDVVVTAGAGTGKTRTLVARYLSLLAQGTPLRAIVAITFTKKAAREMRNRVRVAVRRYLETAGLNEDQRALWQDHYRQLDAARIGTIHSLCTEILRAHPVEAWLDPRFEVLEEGQSNLLRRQAVDETLAWAAQDPQAVTLYALLGERDLRETLETLLQKRLDVSQVLQRRPEELLQHWRETLARRQEEHLTALLGRPEWQAVTNALQDQVPSDPGDRMAVQRQLALEAIQTLAGGPLDKRLHALQALGQIDLRGGSYKAWPGGKAQLKAVKDNLKTLRKLGEGPAELLTLTLTPLDETLAQALPALHAALAHACRRYDALKRERDSLDFDDLEHRALQLLQEHTDVRARWQDEICAILVDEFQDTNDRQRDLVQHLNQGGGRLFIVGDGKQSIYRFRGADVSVFRDERDAIARQGGQALALQTSYRAHRALVQGLNDLLRPVLGETADPARPWIAPFAPLKHDRAAPGPGFRAPYIELHLTVGSKSDGALDRAAEALVERLVTLIQHGRQVMEKKALRPLHYGDIAILCRASTSFGAYEDALEQAEIPFLTVAGRGFYDRPEIRDLLNALQALADPSDDLALAGLLRSPALALSDATLYHLCQARETSTETLSLWQALQETEGTHPDLEKDQATRARRASHLITTLHDQVGRVAVADLLKTFLDATDYRAALVQAGQRRGARNVDKLLADAHASAIVSVGEFLEYVDGLRGSGAREGEARATVEGAVQIMSVHAAKGLEFPVVVIGDVTHGQRGRHTLLVDPELGLLLPCKQEDERSTSYCWGKNRANDQEDAESDRLLYVAATRVREKLILSGYTKLKTDGTFGRLSGWLGKLATPLGLTDVKPEYDEQGQSARHLALQVGETPVACTLYEPNWSRAHTVPLPPAQPTSALPLPPPLLAPVASGKARVDQRTIAQERTPPQRVWRVVPSVKRPRAPAWVIGQLVHEALAAWHFPVAESSDRVAAEAFARWVHARARGYGLTDQKQLQDAVRRCRRLLRRFQAHPLFREMDHAARRLHEVPYNLTLEGNVESGVIDALYLHAGRWTIVEFKTDRVRDRRDLEKKLSKKDYLAQARRYVVAVERLLGQRPRCVLCMLNYAREVYVYPVSDA